MVSWWLGDHHQILSLIAAISWLSNPGLGSKIQPAVMAKAPPLQEAELRGTLRHFARKVFRPHQGNPGRRDLGSAEEESPAEGGRYILEGKSRSCVPTPTAAVEIEKDFKEKPRPR